MARRSLIVAGSVAGLLIPAGAFAAGETAPPASVAPAAGAPAVMSAFKADRTSSMPLGLVPDDVTKPLAYPDEPIVLTWSAVPGAALYKIEVSSNPAFTDIEWSAETDQTQIAPEILFPDGSYWWRVTATDAAGVVGLTSTPARFAKTWTSVVKSLKAAATPGGPSVSVTDLQAYFTWNPLLGAVGYDLEVAAGDQFASPQWRSQNYRLPFMTPAGAGVLPDDTYRFRVRARDAKGNAGPWSVSNQLTKTWVAVEPEFPADDAATHDMRFRWKPIQGAEYYEFQMTAVQHTWVGPALRANAKTDNVAISLDLAEMKAKNIIPGDYWWRVRPVVAGTYGGWSPDRHVTYAPPATTTPEPVLQAAPDTDSALMPELVWTPATGAKIYRVDIATDPNFHNKVSAGEVVTSNTSWVPRQSFLDNQADTGYWWRVVWGTGTTSEAPGWVVSEASAPKSMFRKQTKVSLVLPNEAVVSEPPLLSWLPTPGVARYEVQASQSPAFDAEGSKATVVAATVWGTGTTLGAHEDNAKNLAEGTWYWRVRPVDAVGNGQTWSPARQFTLTGPRVSVASPEDGQTVVGAPLMKWSPLSHTCGYEVQISTAPSFEKATALASTVQNAIVLTKTQIPTPGRYYWRVRPDRCDTIKGQWSPTRSFKSVLPPDFGLNTVPTKVDFGSKTVVAGALSFGGSRVKSPTLVLERRVWPETDFGFFGTVKGDTQGRFAFRLKNSRTTAYRLRWEADPTHPAGEAPFAIRVQPRVAFSVAGRKVARRGKVMVRGSVYPARVAYIQSKTSGGWETIRTLRLKTPRFSFPLKATLVPGQHRLRVLVPGDQRLATNTSKARPLFVFDRFVIKAGKGK